MRAAGRDRRQRRGILDLQEGARKFARRLARDKGKPVLDPFVYVPFARKGWMVPNQYWTPGVLSPMPIMGKYYMYYGNDFVPPRTLGRMNAERFREELILDNLGMCRFHRQWAEEMLPEIVGTLFGKKDEFLQTLHVTASRINSRNASMFWESARNADYVHTFLLRHRDVEGTQPAGADGVAGPVRPGQARGGVRVLVRDPQGDPRVAARILRFGPDRGAGALQDHGEGRPGVGRRADLDAAAHFADQHAAQPQAQAGAAGFRPGGEERLEDLLQVAAGNPDPGVGHLDGYVARVGFVAGAQRAGADRQPAALRHGRDRVQAQVEQDFLQRIGSRRLPAARRPARWRS